MDGKAPLIAGLAIGGSALAGATMLRGVTWKMSAETMGLAALSAGDAAAFLSGVNPSLFTIRKFQGEWGTGRDIRTGMVLGNSLALMVGLGATAVSGSWWPLTLTAVCAGVLDIAYEWALRNARSENAGEE